MDGVFDPFGNSCRQYRNLHNELHGRPEVSVAAEAKSSIQNLLREKYRITRPISDDTRVYHDLKLRGLDAHDFLSTLFHRYSVDATSFRFSDFFKGEYFSPADILNYLLRREDRTRKPLTVGHLVNVCAAGRWFEP